MTHRQVLDLIWNTYNPAYFEKTCDGFKFGNPDEECTGMVTSCALTIRVIQEAIRLGCNLIMVHEPSFYSDWDDTEWLEGNAVFVAKKKLLEENGIAVCRHHDHMHGAMKPDEIMQGVIKELGWVEYVVDDGGRALHRVKIPPVTLRELVEHLQKCLKLETGRVVGRMDAVVSNVVFCGHVFPSWNEKEREHTKLLNRDDVDVLIPGELIDWTVVSYARDAEQLGLNKAIIQTGHFAWEEPGMKWLAVRLKALLPGLPVHYCASGDPYHFL